MGLLETKEELLAREQELNNEIEALRVRRDALRAENRDLMVVNDFVCGSKAFKLEQRPGVAVLSIVADFYTRVVVIRASPDGKDVSCSNLDVPLTTDVIEALHTAVLLFKDHQ
jgi:hypothetical protein